MCNTAPPSGLQPPCVVLTQCYVSGGKRAVPGSAQAPPAAVPTMSPYEHHHAALDQMAKPQPKVISREGSSAGPSSPIQWARVKSSVRQWAGGNGVWEGQKILMNTWIQTFSLCRWCRKAKVDWDFKLESVRCFSELKILFTAVRHYPTTTFFFDQLIFNQVTHIYVISASARSHVVVVLVSQIGREICLQRRVILIKTLIFGASDSVILRIRMMIYCHMDILSRPYLWRGCNVDMRQIRKGSPRNSAHILWVIRA